MKKTAFILSFVFIFNSFFYSASLKSLLNSDKKALYEASISFNGNDYGKTLAQCEEAKKNREEIINYELRCLNNSFSSYEIKRFGDSISLSMETLEKRQDLETISIIERYFFINGKDFFADSKNKLLQFVESKKSYPEADYLIGKVYKVEGEYDVSLLYYNKALSASANLDIPDQKYEILYSVAELSLLKKDFNQYEIDLLQVAAQDENYKKDNLKKSIKRAIENVKPDCVEKFFKMFRDDNQNVMDAYYKLALLYSDMNEKDRSMDCISLGSLSGFTKVLKILSDRNPEYEYSDFSSFLIECANHEDIIEWGKANNLWNCFYKLGEIAYKNDSPIFAVQLFKILEKYIPDEEIRNESSIKLSQIVIH